MGIGGCCFSDGVIPGSILLFWAVDIRLVSASWSCVGLVVRSGVIVGLSGCGSAFGFRFRGCFGLWVMGDMGDGKPGSFYRGLRLLGAGGWGLGDGGWGMGDGGWGLGAGGF